jgi:type I restriction enzyme M protein
MGSVTPSAADFPCAEGALGIKCMIMATATHSAASAVQIEPCIHRIFDHLYANAPVRTPRAIAHEVGKVLHIAMFLERGSDTAAFNFTRQEQKRLEAGDDFAALVALQCRTAFGEMNKAWNLYPLDETLNLQDFDLAFVCSNLAGILVSDKRRDVFGDALEIFRYEWAKRNGGQFFTDQRVTHLAVSLLDFRPDQGDDLVDICAGTGGFLLAGLNAIQNLAARFGFSESEVIDLASRSLKGQEADPDIAEVCNATLTARLGSAKASVVSRGNSLINAAFQPSGTGTIRYDTHTCAATNPPFGTKITVKDPSILRHYELAIQGRGADLLLASRVSPRAPDVLFLEQNLKLLKPGAGRLAIVVPYQIMSGPQTTSIREWLLRNAEVIAVVDLPAETFQPHTGTKTSLLVLKRRKEASERVSLSGDKDIFMATPRWIGHDRRGNPLFRRNPDGTLSSDILSDFDEVERSFRKFLEGTVTSELSEGCFRIKASQVQEDPQFRLNAQFHRPQMHAAGMTNMAASIPDGWSKKCLGDVVKRIFYPGRFKRNYVAPGPEAVPFLGGTNISQLLIVTDKWIDRQAAVAQDLLVEPGWILVTRSGSTGIVSSVPQAWNGFGISEHVIRIVPDSTSLPGEFVLAYLKTAYAQEVLARGVYGSVIDEINPELIAEMEIPVPPTETLQQIIETVRAGEIARNHAIESLLAGTEMLEQAMKTL